MKTTRNDIINKISSKIGFQNEFEYYYTRNINTYFALISLLNINYVFWSNTRKGHEDSWTITTERDIKYVVARQNKQLNLYKIINHVICSKNNRLYDILLRARNGMILRFFICLQCIVATYLQCLSNVRIKKDNSV